MPSSSRSSRPSASISSGTAKETFATRVRRFNLGLIELSAETGVSIIDVESIVARAGADRHTVDALHLSAEAYALIADEVLRVLDDLGAFHDP